jgi:PAS domain S-box-containing protein
MFSRFNLTLSRKAIILVSVPLIFELLFVAGLVTLLEQAEQERAREAHARDVATHANSLLRLLLDAGISSILTYLTESESHHKRYRHLVDVFNSEARQLKMLVSNNEHESAIFDRLAVLNQVCIKELNTTHDSMVSGDKVALLKKWVSLQKTLNQIFQLADQLVEEQQAVQLAKKEAQIQYRNGVKLLIFVAVIFNILLALALVAYYNRGTTRRLKALVDNTRQLAANKPLNAPIKGDNDEIAELDSTFRSMALALAEALRKERAVVENAADVICSIDEQGRLAGVNNAAIKVWGYEPDQLIGLRLSQLLEGEQQQSTLASINTIVSTKGEGTFENQIKHKDGKLVDMLWTGQWSEQEKALFCVAHDITERKKIESLKQDFIAMISHDLRTPLTSVQGFLDLLEVEAYGPMSRAGKESLELAEMNIDRVVHLVNDILDIEKLESGMLTFQMETVNLDAVIVRSIESVTGFAKQQQVSITYDRALADTHIEVMGDFERLTQVVVNLLANAVKFSEKNGLVQVVLKLAEDIKLAEEVEFSQQIQVEIIDGGRGVPKNQRASIFERFRQVELSDGHEGSGLGLAICRALIEEHGGTIGVDDLENGVKGSKFWFKLPRKK